MIPITNDLLLEIDEDFFGVLTLPAGVDATGVTVSPDRTTVTIADRDSKSTSLSRSTPRFHYFTACSYYFTPTTN